MRPQLWTPTETDAQVPGAEPIGLEPLNIHNRRDESGSVGILLFRIRRHRQH